MAKREYLELMRRRYRNASRRQDKSRILDEICATTGYDRKYIIRFLAGSLKKGRPKSRPGRPKLYEGPHLLRPIKKIWLTANLPCSKRLKAMIPAWLPGYESCFESVSDEVKEKLLSISASTIDRLLKQPRMSHQPRGKSTTKPGGLLRAQIPIQTGQWEEKRPGFVEADTVAHCGGSMAGEFVFTLDCVDIATGWSEQRALWSKGAAEVVKQMRCIERSLPFPLLGFDSDNGSEFINKQLVRHFLSRQRAVKFTRSRAYKKNDNAHIEQKNWTHVRQWIGYERIDDKEAVVLLNSLYTNEWRLFHNLYCPSVKLLSKERVGSKIIKKYDEPKTPYLRTLESPLVSEYAKKGLRDIYEQTNPFILEKAMKIKLRKLSNCIRNNTKTFNPAPDLG